MNVSDFFNKLESVAIRLKNGWEPTLGEVCQLTTKGCTNYKIAIENNHFECIHPRDYQLAFDEACGVGSLEIVKRLVEEANIKPHQHDNVGIHVSSGHGHLEVVKYLAGLPSVDPLSDDDQAIDWALWENHVEVVKFLSKYYVFDQYFMEKLFVDACEAGYIELVKFLEELMIVVPQRCVDNAITRAIWFKQSEVVIFLTKFYLNESRALEQIFMDACIHDLLDLIKYLVTLGVNPDFNSNEAIKTACLHNRLEVVKYLVTLESVNPAANENEPLMMSLNLDVVKFLTSLDSVKAAGIERAIRSDDSCCNVPEVTAYLKSLIA